MLYSGIVEAARPTCWMMAGRSAIPIARDRLEQVCHDTATRIVERYLRHKRYMIRSFGAAIRLEVLHALTEGGHSSRPTRRIQRAEELSDCVEAAVEVEPADPATYLQDLLDDGGAEVVLALVRGSSYPRAIRSVSKLVSRLWIYSRAVKLRHVWVSTRRRRCGEENVSVPDARRGNGRGGKGAVQALRVNDERDGQRVAAGVLRDRRAGGKDG
jgi:hypothetical protein